MYDHVLEKMQECVHNRGYVMTTHAEDEMDTDDLTIYDIETIILTCHIVARQKDRDSAQWKYLILAGPWPMRRRQVLPDLDPLVSWYL